MTQGLASELLTGPTGEPDPAGALDPSSARAPLGRREEPLIDCQDNGIGDVVVACWIVDTARAAGRSVTLNPRGRADVATLLGIDGRHLTSRHGPNWTKTASLGLEYEYANAHDGERTRFNLWCESLGLPGRTPVRPAYVEDPEDGHWADDEWQRMRGAGTRLMVAMFPGATRSTRVWPRAYFIDLANDLAARGATVLGLGSDAAEIHGFPAHWWWGLPLARVAALVKRADLVIANDSGPAHLAGTIGVPTVAICGPTDGRIVYGHDPNVWPVALHPETLACTGCHFSRHHGYREACDVGGCQALMRLTPDLLKLAAVRSWKRSFGAQANP